jgi:hypothetical protein
MVVDLIEAGVEERILEVRELSLEEENEYAEETL